MFSRVTEEGGDCCSRVSERKVGTFVHACETGMWDEARTVPKPHWVTFVQHIDISLDIDVVRGGGPETISFHQIKDGDYYVYVHRYVNVSFASQFRLLKP